MITIEAPITKEIRSKITKVTLPAGKVSPLTVKMQALSSETITPEPGTTSTLRKMNRF